MTVCDGKGDSGDHCCYIGGRVCEALELTDGTPRCSFMSQGKPLKGNPVWEALPVGRWFGRVYPNSDCADWPQNIPNVTGGLCCWDGEL